MKLYKRLLSLLLVCVLLFGAFSTTANASNDFDLETLYWAPQFRATDGSLSPVTDAFRSLTALRHYTYNNVKAIEFPQELRLLYTSSNESFNFAVSDIVVPKGDGFKLELNNLRDRIVFYDSNGNEVGSRYRTTFAPDNFIVYLYGVDGSWVTVTPDSKSTSLNNNRISFSISVNESPIDVAKFMIVFVEKTFPYGGVRPDSYSSYARQLTFDQNSSHFIKKIPEEKGLLKSMVSWLASIKSGITDMFNSIAELPNKLLQGIKSLFVPSEDYFDNYGDRWDELLSSRFGAVYEVGTIAVDFARSLLQSMNGTMSSTIEFPTVSIPVGNNTTFDFGGWSVPIQVQGMSFLYSASRTIFGVVGTLLFIKGMRRKYDEVMGVET